MQPIEFDAIIKTNPEYVGSAYVDIPFDVEKTFNGKKRVKIKALIEGFEYRGTLVRMGTQCHILIIVKEIREKNGKQVGDLIHISLKEDTEERTIEIPDDFKGVLNKNPKAFDFFNTLAFTHRKEYVNWITSAKRIDTRNARLQKAILLLLDKKKEAK